MLVTLMLLDPTRTSLRVSVASATAAPSRNTAINKRRVIILRSSSFRRLLFFTMQGAKNLLGRNRQIPDPNSHGIINRVRNRRRHLRDCAFADFFALKGRGSRPARDTSRTQWEKVLYIRNLVLTEIRSRYPAVIDKKLLS